LDVVGKLVKAIAAKHSEKRLKFCGHAEAIASGKPLGAPMICALDEVVELQET
jgi:hypothetical protein